MARPIRIESAGALNHVTSPGDRRNLRSHHRSIIGIMPDPRFGLALAIGSSGILVELLRAGAALLIPASREE